LYWTSQGYRLIFQTLVGCTTRRLLKIKGFSEIKVEKLKDAAKKLAVGCHCSFVQCLLTIISLLPVVLSLLPSLANFAKSVSESRLVASSLTASCQGKPLISDQMFNGLILNSGFQTMSICEVYGEFSMSSILPHTFSHLLS
jgi:hypothetical protein